jgi:hypothetical protein
MEDVSQSLQEAHERCHQLSEDIADLRDVNQSKMDAKVDITTWNEMNDDIDASIKTVRDMVSSLDWRRTAAGGRWTRKPASSARTPSSSRARCSRTGTTA